MKVTWETQAQLSKPLPLNRQGCVPWFTLDRLRGGTGLGDEGTSRGTEGCPVNFHLVVQGGVTGL